MFRCNKCWKKLGGDGPGQVYITACSHMFCIECLEACFKKAPACPGCEKPFLRQGDVQLVDLNPSEEFRSMSLCGLVPETIMEMAARGLSFFQYQKQNEISYLQFLNRKAQQRIQQLERGYNDKLMEANRAITVLNSQVKQLRDEHECGKKDYAELESKLREKTQQKRKLEELYDQLKSRYEQFCKTGRSGSLHSTVSPSKSVLAFTRPASISQSHTTAESPLLPTLSSSSSSSSSSSFGRSRSNTPLPLGGIGSASARHKSTGSHPSLSSFPSPSQSSSQSVADRWANLRRPSQSFQNVGTPFTRPETPRFQPLTPFRHDLNFH
ncbi:MAG: putative E3 ubiquitin-protein ligase CCNB1IP1 [Streblomastix strix]|uniref:Putative E3 ubiquitin-protein ligase CCNB1IP1 n=1 Tax=Streblomastix strix TaxID=222440 RepID=A0A5J4U576_9EUKA|nr:MAG: putative E3 ubiquitin-protein ligase CCNB1IP1 [Streblomastix strix]